MKKTSNILSVLRQLNELDYLTLVSCLHHCAVHPKKEREEFKKEYGTKIDDNITDIMIRLQ